MPSEAPDLVAQLSSLRLPPPPTSSGASRWVWGGVSVAGAVALVLAVYALRDRFVTAVVELTPVLSLQPGQEAPLFVATGTLTAPVTDSLAPRAPGRLLRLLVQEGDLVEPGQSVALLDPTDRQLAVSQTRAQVASAVAKVQSAEVAVKAAEVHLARAQRLAKTGAGTESVSEDASLDLETANAQLGVARADAQVARSQAEVAQANLDDTSLKAPFRGVVIKTLAQPGDLVAINSTQGALQLADLASLEVDAEVAEVNLGKLRVGMPAEVRLDALPSVGLPGEIFAIRPNVDPAKATAIAKVRLTALSTGGQSPAASIPALEQNAKPLEVRLFPGMNGHINFLAKALDAKALAQPTRIEVPSRALFKQGDRLSLLTVDKDGQVVAAPVTVSGSDGDRAILKEGPPPGTLVVATPDQARPGEHVKAKE